jgi:hypothetical protein
MLRVCQNLLTAAQYGAFGRRVDDVLVSPAWTVVAFAVPSNNTCWVAPLVTAGLM